MLDPPAHEGRDDKGPFKDRKGPKRQEASFE